MKQAGFYSYVLNIDAQGPSGILGGYFYLAFKDATGDIYYISIYSSDREQHTLAYNSSSPNIVTVYWSNDGVNAVQDATNKVKTKFQVISPAGKTS